MTTESSRISAVRDLHTVRDLYRDVLDQLQKLVPDGPDKTAAIRALQDSEMRMNLAIALITPGS